MAEAVTTGENLTDALLATWKIPDARRGALECLVGLYFALRATGITAKSEDSRVQRFLSGSEANMCIELMTGLNGVVLGKQISALCAVVYEYRHRVGTVTGRYQGDMYSGSKERRERRHVVHARADARTPNSDKAARRRLSGKQAARLPGSLA